MSEQLPVPRAVDLTERILYLRGIPVAGVLPPSVLRAIAVCLRERSFAPGDYLMREGEPFDAMHFLIEGKLSLVRNGIQIGSLTPPQSIGFMSILARGDGQYDARVLEPIETLSLDAEVVLELLEDHPPLFHATLSYLSERLFYEMLDLPEERLGLPFEEPPEKIGREMDLVEKILFLRTLSALKKANVNSVAAMALQQKEVRLPKGTRLWEIGEVADRTLFVVRGKIDCQTEDGRRFVYGHATAVGGVEAFANKPRWYSAETATDVIALEGQADAALDLMDDNFPLGMEFIRYFANALVGMLEAKAARGVDPLAARRNVSKLGAVPVGA